MAEIRVWRLAKIASLLWVAGFAILLVSILESPSLPAAERARATSAFVTYMAGPPALLLASLRFFVWPGMRWYRHCFVVVASWVAFDLLWDRNWSVPDQWGDGLVVMSGGIAAIWLIFFVALRYLPFYREQTKRVDTLCG